MCIRQIRGSSYVYIHQNTPGGIRPYFISLDIFEISKESIKVTIPYNWQHKFEELVDKAVDNLSKTEKLVYNAISSNPKLSQPELAIKCGVGKTTVQNVIIKLKNYRIIKRIGSNKTGYWEVLK